MRQEDLKYLILANIVINISHEVRRYRTSHAGKYCNKHIGHEARKYKTSQAGKYCKEHRPRDKKIQNISCREIL